MTEQERGMLTDDAVRAANCLDAQVNESVHLNSVGNVIPPTDRPPTNCPRSLGRPSRVGVQVGWMEKWTDVQRR